jgi:hypothetical protein
MVIKRATMSCPSAQPEHSDAEIIGIVRGKSGATLVEPLPRAVPLSALIDLIPVEVRPTEVLRFAAPCAEQSCLHFDRGNCQLAKRIISSLPEVSDRLQPCAIRPTCRWFHQERSAACRRCPQVITEPYTTTELMREVARPIARGTENVDTP